jgi:multicomponent Na+:H+ antiporter subunit F
MNPETVENGADRAATAAPSPEVAGTLEVVETAEIALTLTERMPILNVSVQAALVMVMLAVILAMFRLVKGPSLPDRVVALDTMTVLIVAFCGLFAIDTGVAAFLDVAVVLALVGFLATAALARFVERKRRRPPAETLRLGDPVPAERER